MNEFYLENPSLKRKKDIIEYIEELKKYNSDTNGLGVFNKIFSGYSFEEALEESLNISNEDYIKKNNEFCKKTFLFIRKNDNKLIGIFTLRWNIPNSLLESCGNIGYGIRPTERRKGYGKIQLQYGLLEAKKIGLSKVMIICEESNIASNKIIKSVNGILESSKIDNEDGILTNYYWINI